MPITCRQVLWAYLRSQYNHFLRYSHFDWQSCGGFSTLTALSRLHLAMRVYDLVAKT